MSDWESPETQRQLRTENSNFEWIDWMARWAEGYAYTGSNTHKFPKFVKGHEALGIDIWDYVDYAKEWRHEDYLIYRFTMGGMYIQNGETLWAEGVNMVKNNAPPDVYEKWSKEFEDITGNSVEATLENWDYSHAPSGKIKYDSDSDRFIWLNDESREDEGGFYDPNTGYTYPPPEKETGGGIGETDYSKKGMFAVFYIFYDYVKLMYDFYYDFFDGMLNLSKYPAIHRSYNPDFTKDAFENFMSMVLIYYGSIVSVGLLLRVYRIYYAVKTL